MEIKDENKNKLSDQAIVRVAIVLGIVIAIFLVLRHFAIPASFGQYGHYRGDNISEWAAMKTKYVGGIDECINCHQQVITTLTNGNHKGIDCQSCHGPADSHLNNPKESLPKVLDTLKLCSTCHTEVAARSVKEVPMVVPGDHSGGLICTRCHQPHQPKK